MKRWLTRAWCCYCKRELTPPQPERSTSFTLDHVKAESLGGFKKVPCCRKCNLLKGDLHLEQWFWFIRQPSHARWWKLFDTPEQVKRVVIDAMWIMAHAEKARRDAAREG